MNTSSRHDCIDRATLLRLEDGVLTVAESAATREHLAACPRCRALARELDELRDTLARFSESRPGAACPLPHVLVTYAEGLMAAGERSVLEEHLADCGHCTAQLAALARELAEVDDEAAIETPAWALEQARAMVESPEPAAVAEPRGATAGQRGATAGQRRAPAGQRGAPAETGGFSRFIESLRASAFPLAAAVAMVLMLLVQIPEPRIAPPAIRGGMEEDIAITVPAEPGEVVANGVLSWEPVSGAGTYVVKILDASGAVVWTGQSVEPWIRLPRGGEMHAGELYALWVTTVLDSGVSAESDVVQFTIAP